MFHFLAMATCLMMTAAWPVQAAEPEKALTTEQALAVMEEFRLKSLQYFESIQQPWELLKSSAMNKTTSATDAYYTVLVLSDMTHAYYTIYSIVAANRFYETKLIFNRINSLNLPYDDGYQSYAARSIDRISKNIAMTIDLISNTESRAHLSKISQYLSDIALASEKCVNLLIQNKTQTIDTTKFRRYTLLHNPMATTIYLTSDKDFIEFTKTTYRYHPGQVGEQQWLRNLEYDHVTKIFECYAISLHALRSLYGAKDIIDTFKSEDNLILKRDKLYTAIEEQDNDVTLLSNTFREECNNTKLKYFQDTCPQLLEAIGKIDSTRKALFEGLSRN